MTSDNTAASSAGQSTPFIPEIDIPNLFSGQQNLSGTTLAEYVRAVFVYFIWVVGVLAVIMIMWGGIKWVGAAGNPAQISGARQTITSAVIGLIIALTSVVLLNTINPDLTNFSGLVVKRVDPCVLNYLDEVARQAGNIVAAEECPAAASGIVGDPTQVCSKNGCLTNLNQLINNSATKYSVDPVTVKALIMRESPKQNGNPYSGPTGLKDGTSSGRWGSAYGIGQFTAQTLAWMFQVANVSVPSQCSAANLRQTSGADSGRLIASCQDWMDANIPTQIDFIAAFVKYIIGTGQVSKSPTVISIIYNVGKGGYQQYLAGESNIQGQTMAQTVENARIFNTYYNQICSATKAVQTQTKSQDPKGF